METLRILIAEQDRELRARLRLDLQLSGYLAAEAADGREALEIIQQEPPDVLVLDLEIPEIGSVALLAELRVVKASRRPRAIVLATSAQRPLAVELLRLGANDLLEKPVTAPQLLASITNVLEEPVGTSSCPARGPAELMQS